MLNLHLPKLIQIYSVKNGVASFVCSCGRLSSFKIREYKKHLRCKHCEAVNAALVNSPNHVPIKPRELDELFTRFYDNGLLDFVEDKVGN